jgi:S-adenosylmethionine decarboxylase proenzyme
VLDRVGELGRVMHDAAAAAGVRVVDEIWHAFAPSGVTGTLTLEESHMSIHTWPEENYASLDVYTCGDGDVRAALKVVENALEPDKSNVIVIRRGESGGLVKKSNGVA